MRRSRLPLLALALALVAVGCVHALNPRDFTSSTDLFTAGKRAFDRGKWQNAINAFERLTLDLPTRDTLLPPSHWYLGQARLRKRERLLAAQSFLRLAEQYPQDSLADDAMLAAGDAYRSMWRRPTLDPQYGLLAQTQYRLLAALHPDSPLADTARARAVRIDEWLATKDYETAMHYIRRRAFDSAILYLRDVVAQYPDTEKAKDAMLRLVETYRRPQLRYREDAEEVCATLRAGFPTDPEVLELCKASPGPATRPDSGR